MLNAFREFYDVIIFIVVLIKPILRLNFGVAAFAPVVDYESFNVRLLRCSKINILRETEIFNGVFLSLFVACLCVFIFIASTAVFVDKPFIFITRKIFGCNQFLSTGNDSRVRRILKARHVQIIPAQIQSDASEHKQQRYQQGIEHQDLPAPLKFFEHVNRSFH